MATAAGMRKTNPGYKGPGKRVATELSGYGGSAYGTNPSGAYRAVGSRGALVGPTSSGSTTASQTTAVPKIASQKVELPALPSGTPTVAGLDRPELPSISPTGSERPEHIALRERYTGFGEDLKAGTGFAMDALQQRLRDQEDAQVEMARANANELGIPFDEASFRAELQRGVNAAMVEEKLGREQLYQSHLSDIAPVLAGANYAQGEKQIDLSRDLGEQEGILQRYATDVNRYGTELSAATRANEMLMDFYKTLMSGMMSFGGSSFTGGSVSFG